MDILIIVGIMAVIYIVYKLREANEQHIRTLEQALRHSQMKNEIYRSAGRQR